MDDILGDHQAVEQHAKRHAGNSAPQDRSIFSDAMGMISQNAGSLQNESVDEGHAVKAHKKYYGGGSDDDDGGEATSSGVST